jgi:hypothetical protein
MYKLLVFYDRPGYGGDNFRYQLMADINLKDKMALGWNSFCRKGAAYVSDVWILKCPNQLHQEAFARRLVLLHL